MFTIRLQLAFLLALAALPAAVRAEMLESAPGWVLNRNVESSEEEGVYNQGKVYYTLKPPDNRPAITVDRATADRLRSGEAQAEGVYAGQAKRASSEEDQNVWGTHGNGIQMAEVITSTLTVEEGRKDVETVPQEGPRRIASGGSSFSGFQSFSSSNSRPSRSSISGRRNSSGASAPSGAGNSGASSTAAAAAGSGGEPAPDPRTVASKADPVPVDAGKKIGGPTIGVGQPASGFGFSTSTSTDKSAGDNFIVWPNGDPAENAAKQANAKCETKAVSYNDPQLTRLVLPAGCSGVRVRAWGGGGGAGKGSVTDGEGNVLATSGEGGGAAYVFTQGAIDAKKFDLVLIVGSAGGDAADGAHPGAPGFASGGKGGIGGGGGGGGYSGLFLVDRSKYGPKETPLQADFAIAVAAGGGGGSASGAPGGEGGADKGGGALGASMGAGGRGAGTGSGAGFPGVVLLGGNAGDGGGGGGGGFFGGGGGGVDGTDQPALGGGGGSSFFRFLNDDSQALKGSGGIAGNKDFIPRGTAGNAGKHGRVILEFY